MTALNIDRWRKDHEKAIALLIEAQKRWKEEQG